ncbi:hypothetical protein J2Z44_001618 [Clostridium punense]|uniref:DUF8042 domain-containing protein n=1 Tax=Clostridium punense TaxID=1054297 RepID=A0ABS4K217_9CLOT|nr:MULTISPECIES: hypothetical protein [Clostridium]EQB87112.1 hypothetical protein M918_10750 [Clostridium sp. BL8]MBP2021822.1 hypothetical protein [Clostridium punense]
MNKKQELLGTSQEFIIEILKDIDDISGLLLEDKEEEALNAIASLTQGVDDLIQAMTLTVDIEKGKININEMIERLHEMFEAIQRSDFVLLGDILKYEISPILKNWHLEITSILV